MRLFFVPGSKVLIMHGLVYDFKGLSPNESNLLTHHLH